MKLSSLTHQLMTSPFKPLNGHSTTASLQIYEKYCFICFHIVSYFKRIVHTTGASPECSLEGLMLKLKLQYFAHLMRRVDSLEDWCWEGLGAGGEGDDRGWDGWMASLTWWTWVWVKSGSWWWTGRPGMLQFMGSQRVGHDWATELNWAEAATSGKESAYQCRRYKRRGLNPCVRKIPWRKKWQPTPVFLTGESWQDRGAWQAAAHGVAKSWTQPSIWALHIFSVYPFFFGGVERVEIMCFILK